MALTRKMLRTLGIEEEKIDSIIEAHTETVDALKAERDGFKTKFEELESTQDELKNLRAEHEKNFEKQYNDVKAEYEKYKNDHEEEKSKNAKETAYKELLKQAGIGEKYFAKVVRVTDFEKLTLDKDGKFKDADDLVKGIKDEWAEFVVTDGKQGADTKTPPEGNGENGGAFESRASQLAKKYYENLYGKVEK